MRKQCFLCMAIAEYELKGMNLCEYHYFKMNNEAFDNDVSMLVNLLE